MQLDNLTKKEQDLLKSAEDLFWQFGFKKVTVEDICRKAGSSKMTFYKYFKNKNELIKSLIDFWYGSGLEKFKKIEEMNIPFSEKLDQILRLKAESSSKISKEFAQEYFYLNPEIKEYIETSTQKVVEEFMNFIRRAQEKGEVRKSMKPEFFLAVLTQLQGLVKNDDLLSLYSNYKEFILEFNNFIFYGLLPGDK